MRSSPSRWRQSNRRRDSVARPRATGRATGRDLKRERSLIGVEGDRLAVEHGVAHRQRACDLDDLGHARGHVVEAPAEDRDVAVAHVHLHADSIELPLRARCPEALDRGRGIRCAAGEHRRERTPDLDAKRLERRRSTGERRRADRREVACQQERAAYGCRRDLRGLRNRVDQHAAERALAQVARQEGAQESLLAGRRTPEELTRETLALAARTRPRQRLELREASIDLDQRQRRLARRRRRVAESPVADARSALARLAREEGEPDRRLRGLEPREARGDEVALAEPGRRRRDAVRCRREVGQQHGGLLAFELDDG